MNRDRQMKKDLENKKYQAQEEYEKNKHLLAESMVQEKNDYVRPAEQRNKFNKEEKSGTKEALDKASE